MKDTPGQTAFGAPVRVIDMGWTLWRKDELTQFICSDLNPQFHRDTYDVVSNNCNHFTDRLLTYLVGKSPPDDVMRQPSYLLRSRFVRVLRPLMNHWLRDRVVDRGEEVETESRSRRLRPGELLPAGTTVCLHAGDFGSPVLGNVCTRADSEGAHIVGDDAVKYEAERERVLSWSCGVGDASPAADGMWVKYFSVDFTALGGRGNPGRFVVEYASPYRITVPSVAMLPSAETLFF